MIGSDYPQDTLAGAWDQDMARSSMERWLLICDQNDWRQCPENLSLLAMVLGGSWYFTRFIFFRGNKIKELFASAETADINAAELFENFYSGSQDQGIEEQFQQLSIAKNEIMLKIFLAQLIGRYTQTEIEYALTRLAQLTLVCAVNILIGDDEQLRESMAILGLGRISGYEINFGSDLDLIFLYTGTDQQLSGRMSVFVRKLMRNLGAASAAGTLYEIDTRLRPHGNSGLLLTSTQSFIDYHLEQREIWERQAMIHCRVIIDDSGIAHNALAQIEPAIYPSFDRELLRSEIISMRQLVINQLDTKREKYNLKIGEGGIMDIDFLVNYLQLLHGHDQPSLQIISTRKALQQLAECKKLSQDTVTYLLQGYDYLKRLEANIRVFDMQSISVFAKQAEAIPMLARSMGYLHENAVQAGQDFLDEYKEKTQQIRQIFNDVLA